VFDLSESVGAERELGWGRRIGAAAVAALIVLSAVVGIATLSGPGVRAAPPPFRIFSVGDSRLTVATLNPLIMTSAEEFIITYNVYSTLLTYDGKYRLTNDLAYNYTIGSDQKTWTFHLVPNAVFTDPRTPGDSSHPVTAADVVFSFRLNANESASIFNAYMVQIPWQNVTALDPHTVQIVTDAPFAAMYTTASVIPIFPQYVWSTVRNPTRYANGVPIGSGAMYYDVANTTFGSNFVLRRNPHYFGVQQYCQVSRPDEVFFKGYTSSASMVSDFLSGTSGLDTIAFVGPADYLNALPAGNNPTGFEKWAADAGFVAEFNVNVMTPEVRAAYPQYQTGGAYNNQLLLNYTVRKAMAMSIDKTAVVKYALLGLGREADTLVPSANPWHLSIPASDRFAFDPKAARAMLNAAGWKFNSAGVEDHNATPLYKANGADPLTFRLYMPNTYAAFEAAAINITAWLAQTGIQTTDARGNPGYHVYTYNQMVGIWYSGDYDLWIWDWIFSPISDPSLDVLQVETTGALGPTSDNYYSNATYDALYDQSLTTINPTARRAITDEMQSMLYHYASYILPYYQLSLYGATNGRPPGHTAGWTNYGNWSQAIGDTPDSDLPNLWFRVDPLDNRAPVITSFSDIGGVAGTAATISVSAVDPEAQSLSYTFDFGDGTATVTTAQSSVTHTYAQAGTYPIRVRAADSEWPVCQSATATISPAGANNPPVATLSVGLAHQTFVYPGENVYFNLTVSDVEGDPVYVVWRFGDGSGGTSYVTGTSTSKVVHLVHAYGTVGTYSVTANYTDNVSAAISARATIVVQARSTGGGNPTPEFNPWINYGIPLVIVAAIALAVVATLWRRRKRSQEEREQAGPPGPPPPPPAPPP